MNKKIQAIAGIFVLSLISLNTFADNFSNGADYQVCFTPGGKCISMIVNLIKQAKQSIYMQAYSFDSYKIIDALTSAKERGVDVNIILDKSNLNSQYNKAIKRLAAENIKLWIDTVDGIAHNKVIIVDGKTVETGSFNYTYTAQKYNAENVLIIHDQALAQAYINNWLTRQNHSYVYNKR